MLPWGAMMQAAMAAGLSPEAFWRLSLREWGWLVAPGEALSRADLNRLMQAYPDTDEMKRNHES
jgi:uncharacterized phage protein (TIGR02216 family)